VLWAIDGQGYSLSIGQQNILTCSSISYNYSIGKAENRILKRVGITKFCFMKKLIVIILLGNLLISCTKNPESKVEEKATLTLKSPDGKVDEFDEFNTTKLNIQKSVGGQPQVYNYRLTLTTSYQNFILYILIENDNEIHQGQQFTSQDNATLRLNDIDYGEENASTVNILKVKDNKFVSGTFTISNKNSTANPVATGEFKNIKIVE
jgi:hypothetical protein